MVVETVFPGSADDHSTISTRLFLPAKKVKEKAKKLRNSLTADILSSNSIVSKNILAMTFRQVVLQGLGSFKLSVFCPGTEKDMNNLPNPKEVPARLTVSSSDERFISSLAEVFCSCVLMSTERSYQKHAGGSPWSIFGRYQEPQRISSIDSSICVYRMSRNEIIKNAKKQLEEFNLAKGTNLNWKERQPKHHFWEPPNYSELDNIGGPWFGTWINEFVPIYKLQVDANAFKDAKLEGLQESTDNRWEVPLAHFQMVELASILDMYYEDQYTIPDKELSCGLIAESSVISRNKNSSGKWMFLSFASGCVLIFVSVLAQLFWPNILSTRKVPLRGSILSSTEICDSHLKSLEPPEMEAFCVSAVKKIRDELGWTEDVMVERNVGAWTGLLPGYLRGLDTVLNAIPGKEDSDSSSGGNSQSHGESTISEVISTGADNLAMQVAHDISSYQVVLSEDGSIIGFQPTSRVAVNNWTSNPLAKALYGGRQLSPGLLEPRPKLPHPGEVVPIELLMSTNPQSHFILARPMR